MDNFKLNDLHIDPIKYEVVKDDQAVKVPHRAMDVLVYLVKHDGRIISRKELHDNIWQGAGTPDEVVSRAIADLRKALGDKAKNPTYIQTITGQGVRLLCTPVLEKPTATVKNEQKSTLRPPRYFAVTLIIGAIVISFYALYFNKDTSTANTSMHKRYPLFSTGVNERFPRFSHSGKYVLSTRKEPGNIYSIVFYDTEEKVEKVFLADKDNILTNGGFTESDDAFFYKKYSQTECKIIFFNIITERSKELQTCTPVSTSATGDISASRNLLVAYTQIGQHLGFNFRDLKTGETLLQHLPPELGSGFYFPKFSPKTDKIAYVHRRFDKQFDAIEVFNFDTETVDFSQPISGGWLTHVIWKDDNTLLYSDRRPRNAGIYELSLETGASKLVLDGRNTDFDYDNVNDRFVVSQNNNSKEIRAYDVENKQIIQRKDTIPISASLGAFDFDDTQHIYVKVQMDKYLVNRIAGTDQAIYSTTAHIERMKLSPKGSKVALLELPDASSKLTVLKTDNTMLLQVNKVGDFEWLSDIDLIYTSHDGTYTCVNTEDGTQERHFLDMPQMPSRIEYANGKLFYQTSWGNSIQATKFSNCRLEEAHTTIVPENIFDWRLEEDLIVYAINDRTNSRAILKAMNLNDKSNTVIERINYSSEWFLHLAISDTKLLYSFPTMNTKNQIYITKNRNTN